MSVRLTPTRAYLNLPQVDLDQIRKELTYRNKSVAYQRAKLQDTLQRFTGPARSFLIDRLGPGGYEAKIALMRSQEAELASQETGCLLVTDQTGTWVPSGLVHKALGVIGRHPVERRYALPEASPRAWHRDPPPLRPYQEDAVRRLLEASENGPCGVELCTGCHRRGERVLMFDGTFKKVEEIEVGDRLMGPDSESRLVKNLCRGSDTMYMVETINGQRMYVNGQHILALERTSRLKRHELDHKRRKDWKGHNPRVLVSVEEYVKKSIAFKHVNKIYSTGVEFPPQKLEIDPYFVGLVLGDGHLGGGVSVCTADPEVVSAIYEEADRWGLRVRVVNQKKNKAKNYFLVGKRCRRNPLKQALRRIGLSDDLVSGNKYVPAKYKVNSRKNRLAILAGLLDTDGSLSKGTFDFISKSKSLADDTSFLARSLGFRSTPPLKVWKVCQTGVGGWYWRICLSGDISEIPTRISRKKAAPRRQKKSVSRFGFRVEKVAENEEFYGFTLEGDGLYLTDSFLVTHNSGKSLVACNLVQRLGGKTLVMVPSASIARQMYDDLRRYLGDRVVGMFGGGKKEFRKEVVVGIDDSLYRVKPGTEEWEHLSKSNTYVVDESHLVAAETLLGVCNGLAADAPRRFFFSGTQIRNDGLDLVLEGVVGQIVMRKTVKELADEGYLAKPVFRSVRVPTNSSLRSKDAGAMTRRHLYYNRNVLREAASLVDQFVTLAKRPVLVLIEEIKQFLELAPLLKQPFGFAHGPVGSRDELPEQYRRQKAQDLVEAFNRGDFPVLIGTSAVSVGTDIRVAGAILYLMGGKSEIKLRQAVGRGTRGGPKGNVTNPLTGEPKLDAVFVDFDVVDLELDSVEQARFLPHRHAKTRKKICGQIYGPVVEVDRTRK